MISILERAPESYPHGTVTTDPNLGEESELYKDFRD
jgi:hypothetical protein